MPRVTRPTVREPRNISRRPSGLKLLLRRQKRYVRPAAWGLAGFVVVLGAVMVVHSFKPGGTLDRVRTALAAATNMRVRSIEIHGLDSTPEPLVRAALGVHEGDPMLGFSLRGARERIESINWVESAAVERRLPGDIVIDIRERKPFAIWQTQGKFTLIGRDGTVVTNEDVARFSTLPLVVGAGAPQAAQALLSALDPYPLIRAQMVAAIRVGERRWNLRLKSGADLMLPEGHEAEALARLAQLEQQDQLLERPLAVIDMRLADRLVVRPAQAAAPAPAPAAQGRKA